MTDGPADPTDTNADYWRQYSHLQRIKHELIRCYLGGWFAKLGSWAGRVLYLDTHAGKGRHRTGEEGSPLVALNTLLRHTHRDRLLRKCEFVFILIEVDHGNSEALEQEIKALGILPGKIRIQSATGDCFAQLKGILGRLQEDKSSMAPAFIFVDPYGFKVPGALLRDLMSAGNVELFINIIWRELDMAIANAKGDTPASSALSGTLDLVFDGPEWRTKIASNDFDVRADQAIDLLREKLSAKWATSIRMLGDNRATRYVLCHFTNHDAGRDLMKDCMWKVCPDGGFYARKTDDPSQEFLVEPRPDLGRLREWVVSRLSSGPTRWQQLLGDLRPEIWRAPHLTRALTQLRDERKIVAEPSKGRFGPTANPLLRLPPDH